MFSILRCYEILPSLWLAPNPSGQLNSRIRVASIIRFIDVQVDPKKETVN